MEEAIDELLKYEKGWTENMGTYWRERMERLRTIDTGALYSSIKGHLEQGTVTTIEHTFLQYGIYVAAGVGPAHVWKKWTEAQGGEKIMRPNDGDLDFLNKQYRAKHDLNKPKKWVLHGAVEWQAVSRLAEEIGFLLNTMHLS